MKKFFWRNHGDSAFFGYNFVYGLSLILDGIIHTLIGWWIVPAFSVDLMLWNAKVCLERQLKESKWNPQQKTN
jgi:hypothetical protein